MARHRAAKTINELLVQARATLPGRPPPAEAFHAQANGALLIDIREDDQRRDDGLIPGAIVLPRNSLEWRCDPESAWRHPAITRRDLRIILICNQGYQSSLAAATLQQLGLIHATDLDGGFTAWAAAGLPVIAPAQSGKTRPAAVTPKDLRTGLVRPTGSDGRNLLGCCHVAAAGARVVDRYRRHQLLPSSAGGVKGCRSPFPSWRSRRSRACGCSAALRSSSVTTG